MALSTSPTRPYSDSYLYVYSDEHIAYEISMFFEMVKIRRKFTFEEALNKLGNSTLVNNALIESFVIHLRNLIEFFYGDYPKSTDVVAADFCGAGIWEVTRPAITTSLKTARTRANKEIAHLTTYRISGRPPEKEWDFAGLAVEIKMLLDLFIAQAASSRLSQRLCQAIR